MARLYAGPGATAPQADERAVSATLQRPPSATLAPPYPCPMDEQTVREHARMMCDAIVAGDVDTAIADASPELRRNLGEVIGLFPLPATEAAIESITQGGSSFVVVLRMVGETDEVQVQTRWKDRDGSPTLVEASHLSRTERVVEAASDETEDNEPA